MSHENKLKNVMKKLGPKAEELSENTSYDSLEHFYKVKNNKEEKVKKTLKYDFTGELFENNGLLIVPITDVHLGSKHCNIPYFKAFVQYILDTPNCYTICNGDLAETATKVSVGMAMFEEDKHFPEQLQILKEILQPLADAGKILGMGPGNHEERIANMIGINPMQILAEKLDVPYFGYQGFFVFRVGDIQYKMVVHHGAGGGATTGSKANTSEKMNKVVGNADIYFSGHTHAKMYHPDKIFIFDDETGDIVPHIRHYIVGGSFVEYWGAYPEMKALPPSITGLTRIEMRPDQKDIRVIV